MKKVRKGKKILISAIVIFIAIIVLVVVLVVNKSKNKNENQTPTETDTVISLPDTNYSDMEVSNNRKEYLADQDKTMVSLSILNTTNENVSNEKLNAILIGSDENVLGQMETYIQTLDAGDQYNISVVLKGNLTGTKLIKLEKVTDNQ